MGDAAADFLIKLVPELITLGLELYKTFAGDSSKAAAVIKAMKAEIVARREENDAALARKYPKR